MATLLGQLLRGSTLAYNRADCIAMDSSSTSLPAASASLPTADGVSVPAGARVLYTALTAANEPSGWVYVCVETSASGSNMYSMQPAHDSRNPNQTGAGTISVGSTTLAIGGGAPSLMDMILIDQGSTNAGKLMCYSGSAWTDTASL